MLNAIRNIRGIWINFKYFEFKLVVKDLPLAVWQLKWFGIIYKYNGK